MSESGPQSGQKSGHVKDNGKAARKATRTRRLSAALRENLKRRKAQIKGRQGVHDAAAGPAREPHDSAGIGADKPFLLAPLRPAGED